MMNQKINDSPKSQYEVTLSDDGWNGVQSVAKKLGVSVPELLEKVGRGELAVLNSEELEDLLDTIDGLEGLLSAKEEGTVSWEQVKAELGS
ncbi:hypothetical protein NDA00_13155 [Funiculus sociatus GB2-M2]|uniref:hypothetical protein n=1 Tax=Cyanophyceae TaxID=3028117 RepID=UPI001A7EDDDA|nr:hypothetical protein [Trichocoleus sp. FACHB-90]